MNQRQKTKLQSSQADERKTTEDAPHGHFHCHPGGCAKQWPDNSIACWECKPYFRKTAGAFPIRYGGSQSSHKKKSTGRTMLRCKWTRRRSTPASQPRHTTERGSRAANKMKSGNGSCRPTSRRKAQIYLKNHKPPTKLRPAQSRPARTIQIAETTRPPAMPRPTAQRAGEIV